MMLPGDTGRLISIRAVTVRYADFTVLDAIDLSIDRSEVVTLIGPNGSGKTSLVRVALGLQRPTLGQVTIASQLRIGYVPQHFHIDHTLPMTVGRFLRLGIVGGAANIRAALDQVHATHLHSTPLYRISGGEVKRVLLARALLRKPDLLVLDEPSAGVDVTGQAEMYDLVKAIRDRHHCGVLLVSHDLHLVMAATDHVVCLNHHICCEGRPEAVAQHPEYLTLFGPYLPHRLAVYTHDHDHRHDLAGNVDGANRGV